MTLCDCKKMALDSVKNLLAHCKVCGIKFPNPYGLASAPPATTCAMIR